MKNKKLLSIILMLICACCLSLGQFIWKIMPNYNIIYIIAGFFIYCLGGIFMILAYRYGELSVLQPINSMSYVFAAILSVFLLKETLPVLNIIGILLIISGIILIGRSNK